MVHFLTANCLLHSIIQMALFYNVLLSYEYIQPHAALDHLDGVLRFE
jgi:hypothetical protein